MTDADAPPGYRRDARGNLIAEANVSEVDKDMDRTVLRIHGFGEALSEQMWRFRDRTMADMVGLVDRVVTAYGGRLGGRKGNITATTFDGLRKVVVAQAEHVQAGPEIAAAQTLIEECVDEWGAGAEGVAANLRALAEGAFKCDATGRVSVAQLLRLRRVRIDDPRWLRAQAAIADALRPVGRAEYVRLYRRATSADPWEQVPLHLATVRRPDAAETDPRENLVRRARSAIQEARHCGMKEGEIMDALQAAKRRRPKAAAAESVA